MTKTVRALAVFVLGTLAVACDEQNPFRTQPENVTSGQSQVWELALPAFPSGWDFPSGQRLFIGTTSTGGTRGTWVLDTRVEGTLIFRPFSTIAAGISLIRTGIADLGAVPFESVEEVPEAGYSAIDDSTGVPVVEGHVYAFRITTLGSSFVPINYAKLEVTEAGQQFPGDPASRFIRFRWAYQEQPLNRRVVEEE